MTASWKIGLFCLLNLSKLTPSIGGESVDGFLVGWFKTAKHRFGLHRFGQATLLGVYRWLVLSLIAFILAHWAYLSIATTAKPDCGQAAQIAFQSCFPQLLLLLILQKRGEERGARGEGWERTKANASCGYKAHLKTNNYVEIRSTRHKTSLLQSHVFKRGFPRLS